MGKTFLQQTSYASGELSPLIQGRVDREIYHNGAALIRNAVVSALGGVKKRSGTKYITNTTSNNKARLVSFEFNNEQTYLLVFTSGTMKVYKDDVLQATVTSSPISAITETIAQEMNFTQSADTLILVHPDLQPIEITRTSDTAWTASYISLQRIPQYSFADGSYTGTNEVQRIRMTVLSGLDTGYFSLILDGEKTEEIFYTPSSTATSATNIQNALRALPNTSATGITVSSVSSVEFLVTFGGDDGNRSWPIMEQNQGVVSDRNGEEYKVYVTRNEAGDTGGEDVWSATRGWPTSVTFWQQRLWFGGSKQRPQTIWGSQISDFYDFYLGDGRDDQAIEITIDDDQVNAVQNIFAGRTLQVFTTGGEFFTPLSATDRAVTPETITLEKASRHGSSAVTPLSSDGVTLFVDRSGKVAREYLYLDVEQSYVTEDVSFLAEHLMRSPTRMALRPASSIPSEYVYFVNDDGTIAVLNRRRSQSFIAWSLFTTEGEYEDVSVVGDDVYVVVKRTINGSTVRFVERFDDSFYSDAGEDLSGSAQTVWTGLSRYEGEEVFVRSDQGVALDNETVSSGQITIDAAEDGIQVGLPFTLQVRSLAPEHPRQFGLSGQKRRIATVNFNMYNSDEFEVKTKGGTVPANLDVSSGLYSGWKKVHLRGYDREPYQEAYQRAPKDWQVRSLTMEVTT